MKFDAKNEENEAIIKSLSSRLDKAKLSISTKEASVNSVKEDLVSAKKTIQHLQHVEASTKAELFASKRTLSNLRETQERECIASQNTVAELESSISRMENENEALRTSSPNLTLTLHKI